MKLKKFNKHKRMFKLSKWTNDLFIKYFIHIYNYNINIW